MCNYEWIKVNTDCEFVMNKGGEGWGVCYPGCNYLVSLMDIEVWSSLTYRDSSLVQLSCLHLQALAPTSLRFARNTSLLITKIIIH